jgi:hypothetical protein
MTQLVGLRCVRCEREIWSDSEGCFCLACGTPSHHHCSDPDQTPASASRCAACRCNLDNPFAVRFREEQRRQQDYPAKRVANLIFAAAMVLHLIFVVNLAFGIPVTYFLVKLDPGTGAYVGAVWLLFLAAIEVVAVALHRRSWWAWIAAIVVFVLSLPSIAGLAGLLLLIRPGVRAEFIPRSQGEGDDRVPVNAGQSPAAAPSSE